MATKSIRKIQPTTQNEVIEVDMAVRDGNGKVISSEYATKSEATTVAENASSGINTNALAIQGLDTRLGTAETTITGHGTRLGTAENSITDHGTRLGTAETNITNNATAISSEASTRSSADTALQNAITALTTRVDGIQRTAQGGSRSFVIDTSVTGANNGLFTDNNDTLIIYNGSDAHTPHIFKNVTCPNGVLASGNVADVVFVPEGLPAAKRTAVENAVGGGATIVELKLGDAILIKQTDLPDRWVSGYDSGYGYIEASRFEIAKLNVDDLDSAISSHTARITALESGKQDKLTFDNSPSANSNNPVKSGGIYTALAGKQNTLTFDDSPASASNNPVKSGGVYTALAGKQDDLHLTSEIIGTVTI